MTTFSEVILPQGHPGRGDKQDSNSAGVHLSLSLSLGLRAEDMGTGKVRGQGLGL